MKEKRFIMHKFDMHCHTREGSIDAKVCIGTYIQKLKEEGFSGMLVTDHNSYNGYKAWAEANQKSLSGEGFTVLKGIEYDTRDGGHVIAVLPDGVTCKLLEIRGLSLRKLEEVVHGLGGILGPAHPYGTGFFALMNNRWVKKHKDIIEKFDFIETFNSCTLQKANDMAKKLAGKLGKVGFAGSDAHKLHLVGTACTIFDSVIRCNNDLIKAVKEQHIIDAGGDRERILHKKHNALITKLGIIGYWIYNKSGAFLYAHARKRAMRMQG